MSPTPGSDEPDKAEKETKLAEEGSKNQGWTAEYVTREVLLGVTIAFAQIPESVAFAFLANVKPPVALHAAWMVGFISSAFGGRPGMVNGATGAFAAIISTFLPEPKEEGGNGEGVELLFPSVIGAGILAILFGFLRLERFILLLPSPVMMGFCNGLAIVIGAAQLHPFEGKGRDEFCWMLAITFVSMSVMEFLPKIPLKLFKVIPSSLMAIISAITMEFAIVRPAGFRTDTIRDVSEFTADTAYPWPFFVDHNAYNYDLSKITKDWDAIGTVALQALLLATVGAIENLMTSEVVESFCKTPSDGRRTLFAMGGANMLSGFFGGMGGNAMIGLSTINVLNGGRGRLGPIVTALVVMVSVAGAYPILNYIPVAALAGIMLVVVLHTFKWDTLFMTLNCLPDCARKKLGLAPRKIPRIEVVVVYVVMIVAKFANIAYAVFLGVAMCAVAYSWKEAGQFQVTEIHASEEGKKTYTIEGPLFFAAANRLVKILNPDTDPDSVEVVFGYSSIMDYTAVATLQKISKNYQAQEKKIVFRSLNASSQKIIQKANKFAGAIDWQAKVEGLFNEPISKLPQEPNSKLTKEPNGHAPPQANGSQDAIEAVCGVEAAPISDKRHICTL